MTILKRLFSRDYVKVRYIDTGMFRDDKYLIQDDDHCSDYPTDAWCYEKCERCEKVIPKKKLIHCRKVK